jgi:hypothetical protein
MSDLRHKRIPRPPKLIRILRLRLTLQILRRHSRLLVINPPKRSYYIERFRVHRWARKLRLPVMCARRKGCGDPCMYPDFSYSGRRIQI